MDEFFDLPTLIIIAVAIVVLFRLRSVLGTRTGNERPPVERRKSVVEGDAVALSQSKVATVPSLDEERRQRKIEAEIEQYSRSNEDLAKKFRNVVGVDQDFSPKSFLEGAKQAYEMIVTAFAQGDRQVLKNLLDREVYDSFVRVVAEREAVGHSIDFTFVGLPKVNIVDAKYDGKNVLITVDFHAEVVSATRNKDGNLIEGNADQVQIIADEWTFARNPKLRDPNWKLVTTSQLD